eukprot:TRINITY_DN3913_c0_g1_i1.p1 TRINITY_DN3913_c0_g1~~TRINITY_DN3913_c0_g1_i1.p1  ORF type:complete len:608 (-),score=77.91 TRINITY_DN3913_c0_g1_i1:404-2227(-)
MSRSDTGRQLTIEVENGLSLPLSLVGKKVHRHAIVDMPDTIDSSSELVVGGQLDATVVYAFRVMCNNAHSMEFPVYSNQMGLGFAGPNNRGPVGIEVDHRDLTTFEYVAVYVRKHRFLHWGALEFGAVSGCFANPAAAARQARSASTRGNGSCGACSWTVVSQRSGSFVVKLRIQKTSATVLSKREALLQKLEACAPAFPALLPRTNDEVEALSCSASATMPNGAEKQEVSICTVATAVIDPIASDAGKPSSDALVEPPLSPESTDAPGSDVASDGCSSSTKVSAVMCAESACGDFSGERVRELSAMSKRIRSSGAVEDIAAGYCDTHQKLVTGPKKSAAVAIEAVAAKRATSAIVVQPSRIPKGTEALASSQDSVQMCADPVSGESSSSSDPGGARSDQSASKMVERARELSAMSKRIRSSGAVEDIAAGYSDTHRKLVTGPKKSTAVAIEAVAAQRANARNAEAKRARAVEAAASRISEFEFQESSSSVMQMQDLEFQQSLLRDQIKDLSREAAALRDRVVSFERKTQEAACREDNARRRLAMYCNGQGQANPNLELDAARAAEDRIAAQQQTDDAKGELQALMDSMLQKETSLGSVEEQLAACT